MRSSDNRPRSFGSFGMPAADPEPKDDAGVQPVPVLHVGEVHAELRLHVTDETLTQLGSQIASMIAQAARQGFEHGLAEAMRDAGPDDEGGTPPASDNSWAGPTF
jgi:hypothetical protein